MKDPLIYMLADTFQCNLHSLPDGTIRGDTRISIDLAGVWQVTAPLTMVVDANIEHLATAFVRVYGHLWAYTLATLEGVTLMFFDASRVKIRAGAEKEFGLGNAPASVAKLKPHVTHTFFCKYAHGEAAVWAPITMPV